jgi:catechol 2,3-dioxygenase-like lactoylglutathione lyase family enzyme
MDVHNLCPPGIVKYLAHIGYTTENLDEAIKFYCEGLGIENAKVQLSDQPYLSDVTGHKECKLKIGFTCAEGAALPLEIIEYIQPKGGRMDTGLCAMGSAHTSWAVDDIYEICRKLKMRNIELLSPIRELEYGLWEKHKAAFLKDPSGLINQLIEISPCESAKGRIKDLHHVCYVVDDIEATLYFLCDVLGMQTVGGSNGEKAQKIDPELWASATFDSAYARFPNSSFIIELWKFHGYDNMPPISSNMTGNTHLCLHVENMEYSYGTLKKAGAGFAGPPTLVTAGVNAGAYAIYMKPIHGIICELFQGKPTQVK